MSLLYMDGFDAQDFSLRWLYTPNSGTITNSSSTAFSTGYSANFTTVGYNSTPASIKKLFTPSAQVFVGFRFNYVISDYQLYIVNLYTDSAVTRQLYLQYNTTTYTLDLYLGNGTLLANSIAGSQPVNPSTWYYVEMSATIGTAGTAVVRVNGNVVINYSGNTKNGGTSTNVDTVMFGPGPSPSLNKHTSTMNIDDVYVCNSLGSVNNTFLGDVQVQTLLPTGAGSSTQLTPTGSGSNYANANDVPDSTSTYNSSSTAGQRDTYAMGDLAGGTGTVFGLQQVTHAFKTTSGTGNLKAAQLYSSTVSYGATNSLGTSNAAYIDVFENNPATGSPYTASDVNGLEAGGEVA